MLVSIELLSEVLGYKVTSFSHNGYTDGKIGKGFLLHINPSQRADKPSSWVIPKESINFYELNYMLKYWAYQKGYTIVDGIDECGMEICYIIKITGESLDSYFEQNINYETSIKACEYILDKITKSTKGN